VNIYVCKGEFGYVKKVFGEKRKEMCFIAYSFGDAVFVYAGANIWELFFHELYTGKQPRRGKLWRIKRFGTHGFRQCANAP